MAMVIAIIPAFKQTEDAHQEVLQSPFMPCRVAYAKAALDDLRAAVINGDFPRWACWRSGIHWPCTPPP
ncbi:MAG: hypothetical protein HC915_04420 [Anaerolineae bacterium]|nr:hypothetical protein [Anaerolineae bacterium]